MLVIFGINDKVENEQQQKTVSHCFHCNNDSRWILSKVTSKVSLFFIPLIPYKTEYFIYCPICKEGLKIEEVEFEKKLGQ